MKTLTAIGIGLLVLLFCSTIWPTAFRYDEFKAGGGTYSLRVNRLTGDTDRFIPSSGWVSAEYDKGALDRANNLLNVHARQIKVLRDSLALLRGGQPRSTRLVPAGCVGSLAEWQSLLNHLSPEHRGLLKLATDCWKEDVPRRRLVYDDIADTPQ